MVSNESKERIRLDFLPVSLAPQEYAIFKNPNLSRFTKHGPFIDLKTTQAFIARHNQSGNFFGIYLQNGELIGNCQLVVNQNAKTGEVAYGIAEEYWGMGYGTEALQLLLAYGKRTYALKQIIGVCAAMNVASQKVLQKNGFHYVRVEKNALQKFDVAYDLIYFEKTLTN
ncbi:MAG: GNAT family N-acetyltransferase [Liquorilactobacillus satsumensis]